MAKRAKVAESADAGVAPDMGAISAQQLGALAKKKCTMSEAVSWAFAFLRQAMEPKDAPSLIAWRLWEEGQKDKSLIIALFTDVAKKQAQGDDGSVKDAEWDGKKQYDVLKELRASL